ncbi:hypothetical protein A5869_002187, partial [Enterococcus cecorum]
LPLELQSTNDELSEKFNVN